jgi:Transmembrane amino acid transporter protein
LTAKTTTRRREPPRDEVNKKASSDPSSSSSSFFDQLPFTRKQLLMRIAYVSVCALIASAFPFFSSLGGLIGSVGFIPLTFVYPILFWNCSERGQKSPVGIRMMNWILIVVWTIIGVCGMVGSTYFIVQSSSTYGIFPYSNQM